MEDSYENEEYQTDEVGKSRKCSILNPKFEGLFHGIESFSSIEAIQPLLLCPSCNKLFWNPQECSEEECGFTLCEGCLRSALGEGDENCPKCHSRTKFEPNTFLNNILRDMKFHCKKYAEGCRELLEFKDLPFHYCKYEESNQEIENNKDIDIVDGNLHNSECDLLNSTNSTPTTLPSLKSTGNIKIEIVTKYSERCENTECNIELENEERYKAHKSECPQALIKLRCGHSIRRNVCKEHMDSCKKHPVKCRKCQGIIKRERIISHNCIDFLHKHIGEIKSKFYKEVEERKELEKIMIREKRENEEEIGKLRSIICPWICDICKEMRIGESLTKCSRCSHRFCIECKAEGESCSICKENRLCLPCTQLGISCHMCMRRVCTSCSLIFTPGQLYIDPSTKLCDLCPKIANGEIVKDLPLAALADLGFMLLYEEDYSHVTTSEELYGLLERFPNSTLCVGGMHRDSEYIKLSAFGNIHHIIMFTDVDAPVKYRNTYWYFCPGWSFGFSAQGKVKLYWADRSKEGGDSRLSWNMDNGYGGWRLGTHLGLQNNTHFKKVIFVKGGLRPTHQSTLNT